MRAPQGHAQQINIDRKYRLLTYINKKKRLSHIFILFSNYFYLQSLNNCANKFYFQPELGVDFKYFTLTERGLYYR
jgi:hypothetical protein